MYGIEFATGKADLLPASDAVLKEVLKLLKDQPDLKLRIEGHTDNTGNPPANQTLSEKRAQAVAASLISNGIEKNRLTAQGFADTRPVADNSTDEGRARNRRVELVKVSCGLPLSRDPLARLVLKTRPRNRIAPQRATAAP